MIKMNIGGRYTERFKRFEIKKYPKKHHQATFNYLPPVTVSVANSYSATVNPALL